MLKLLSTAGTLLNPVFIISLIQWYRNFLFGTSIEHQETSIDYGLPAYISENLPAIAFAQVKQAGLRPI